MRAGSLAWRMRSLALVAGMAEWGFSHAEAGKSGAGSARDDALQVETGGEALVDVAGEDYTADVLVA